MESYLPVLRVQGESQHRLIHFISNNDETVSNGKNSLNGNYKPALL